MCDDDKKLNITDVQWGRTTDLNTCPQQGTYSESDIPCESSDSDLEYITSTLCHNLTQCHEVVHPNTTLWYPSGCPNDMNFYMNVTYNCVGKFHESLLTL